MDFPERNDRDWFCHTQLQKQGDAMVSFKRPVDAYIVPLDAHEMSAYQHLRVPATAREPVAA